jgi:hypothetical protein
VIMNVHDRAKEAYVSLCLPILNVMTPSVTQYIGNKNSVRYPSLEKIHKPGHRIRISNVGAGNDFDYTTLFKVTKSSPWL